MAPPSHSVTRVPVEHSDRPATATRRSGSTGGFPLVWQSGMPDTAATARGGDPITDASAVPRRPSCHNVLRGSSPTGGRSGVPTHRGSQPGRAGRPADPGRARAQRGARLRDPGHRPAHRGRAARDCSCGRPTRASSSASTGDRASRTSTTRSSRRALTRVAGADAAWVGWGFVAEDPAFAELCAELGVTFIGPPPEAMRLLGDKIEAKVLAEQTGVPVAPWSGGPVETWRRRSARRDHRLPDDPQGAQRRRRPRHPHGARSEDELEDAIERTQVEARAHFGDPSSSWSAWSRAAGTSRCRSSPTTTATSGRPACATARSSGATRS